MQKHSTNRKTESGRRTPQAGTLRAPRSHGGFTVIELLVVIGLIVFLAAILVTTVGNFMGTTREKATQATLVLIGGVTEDRFKRYDSWAEREGRDVVQQIGRQWMQRFIGTRGSENEQFIIGHKILALQHFPQRFDELVGGDGAPGEQGTDDDGNGTTDDISEIGFPGTDDVPFLNFSEFVTDASQHSPETQSSELLYLVLTEGRSFGAQVSEIDFLNDNQLQDTDGDGLMEFVDGWGRPLRFYRWPTRLIRPNGPGSMDPAIGSNSLSAVQLLISDVPTEGANASQNTGRFFLTRDPGDPTGILDQRVLDANRGIGPSNFESQFHTPNTFHTFLLISAGSDGQLGLIEPHNGLSGRLGRPTDEALSSAGSSVLNDNITNRNFQPGRQ